MVSSAGLFIGGAIFGATAGIGVLLLMQFLKHLEGGKDNADYIEGYEDGYKAGRTTVGYYGSPSRDTVMPPMDGEPMA